VPVEPIRQVKCIPTPHDAVHVGEPGGTDIARTDALDEIECGTSLARKSAESDIAAVPALVTNSELAPELNTVLARLLAEGLTAVRNC